MTYSKTYILCRTEKHFLQKSTTYRKYSSVSSVTGYRPKEWNSIHKKSWGCSPYHHAETGSDIHHD